MRKGKKLDRLQGQLMQDLAHELRTPLTSISGFSQLLLEQNFSQEEQKEFLLCIYQQSKHLTDVINAILTDAKLESRHTSSTVQTAKTNGKTE